MAPRGASGAGQPDPYYSMGVNPSGGGGILGPLGKKVPGAGNTTYGGLLAGAAGGAAKQQQQQGGGARPMLPYNAPMMPYVAPPPAMPNPFYGG